LRYERLTRPHSPAFRRTAAGFLSGLAIATLVPIETSPYTPRPRVVAENEQLAADSQAATNDEIALLRQAANLATRQQAALDAERIASAIPIPYSGPIVTEALVPSPAVPSPLPTPNRFGPQNLTGNRLLAEQLAAARGWINQQWLCLNALWTKESQFKLGAMNHTSGAYGIPQADPPEKMALVGADWRTNPNTQIEWGEDHIAAVYGTPCAAEAHSRLDNWY
jgi:hypothetical protein